MAVVVPSPRMWKTYVEEHLMGAGSKLAAGAVVGPGGFAWAQSDHFPTVQANEFDSIIEEFDHPGALANGLVFVGVTYMDVQHVGNSVIKAKIDEASNSGITIFRLYTPLLIGLYDQNPEECSKIVEDLGAYIESH